MARMRESDIVVNGETIPAGAIAAEAQNHPASANDPAAAWQAAAQALAVRKLLLQEASRRGVVAEPRVISAGKRETEEEALVRAVVEDGVEAEPASEAECRAHYAANAARYSAPTLYEAAHILLGAPSEHAEERRRARAAAVAILAELSRDPAAFDRLAQAHSACPSREAGGRLGQIVAGDTVPEFEAALDALEVGQLAPKPVETRFGVHIIRLDARAEGAILPFEAVQDRIRLHLERGAWVQGARRLVAQLIAEAEISGQELWAPGAVGRSIVRT